MAVSRLDPMPAPSQTIDDTVDGDLLLRTLLLAAIFLLMWISFQPFPSLADAPEVSNGGNIFNQLGYSVLFLLLAAWCAAHQPSRLLLLVRPILVIALAWLALCVLTSWEPALSARRFAFAMVNLGIAAMTVLVPRNVRHFGAVLAGAALFVVVLCYLGVLFVPARAVHQASDFLEFELAGDWRGVFAHKNEASAAMALFVLIGLFASRLRARTLGYLLAALAAVFLFMTHSKTSLIILPLVLAVSAIMARVRPALGIGLAIALLLALNVVSVGSVYIEPVRDLLDRVMSDSTFTGRTDVWEFAVDHVMQRPITGYGFAAFWGTPEVVYGMSGEAIWANTAGHAHNGYLDLALTIGIPGSLLIALWLVIVPLFDFYRSAAESDAQVLKMLALRICLFAAYASSFESLLINEGPVLIMLFAATFILRLLSVTRASA